MNSVLCYGDSNTWGAATEPRPDGRYEHDERWPGIMRGALGPGWLVMEEGLSGRTTVHPDPIEGVWLAGSSYLLPCLKTHKPLDAVVVMLGTNDLKARFSVPAGDIAASVGKLLAIIAAAEAGRDGGVPAMLLVCPPPILDRYGTRPDFVGMFAGGYEKSLQLPPLYAAVAAQYGAAFLDAGQVIGSSAFDGIHFDPDAHAALGRAVAEAVSALFPG
jgi:lysophospholipase L1-like esterase